MQARDASITQEHTPRPSAHLRDEELQLLREQEENKGLAASKVPYMGGSGSSTFTLQTPPSALPQN